MRNTLCHPSLSINPWRELDRLFAAATRSSLAASAQSLPASDLFEFEDAYEMRVELPGVEREALSLELKKRELSLRIKRFDTQEAEPSQREIRLQLPRFVDSERIEAKLKNGILSLKLPKSAQAKSREIAIS